MLRKLTIASIITLLILTMGCLLQGPESNPSFSVLPKVLIDLDLESEETKIWVKSAISDFRYNNITIALIIDGVTEVKRDNYTYGLSVYTKEKVFHLDIDVASEDKFFKFYCKVDVDQTREDLIIITTYDEITNEPFEEPILEDDLPYKKILEEVTPTD